MRKTKIIDGNIYYSIQKNPIEIIKFVMSDDIMILRPEFIFDDFAKAKLKAVKMLNKNHFQGLKKLEKPISLKKYDENNIPGLIK